MSTCSLLLPPLLATGLRRPGLRAARTVRQLHCAARRQQHQLRRWIRRLRLCHRCAGKIPTATIHVGVPRPAARLELPAARLSSIEANPRQLLAESRPRQQPVCQGAPILLGLLLEPAGVAEALHAATSSESFGYETLVTDIVVWYPNVYARCALASLP